VPQRSLFTDTTPLEILFAFPESELEIACGTHYTFDEYNLSIILQRRGAHNKLGFAIQLSYLRYPGYAMASDAKPLDTLLAYVSQELQIKPSAWNEYGQHDETRHEHAIEL